MKAWETKETQRQEISKRSRKRMWSVYSVEHPPVIHFWATCGPCFTERVLFCVCSTDTHILQVGVYVSRTWSMRDGAILGGLATMFHMLFLLYLRWEYHKIYEGI